MDLTQINEEEFQRELTRRMRGPLKETYGAVLTQALPRRLQELLRRLDSLAGKPPNRVTSP
jgi:hypothetical protein